MKDSQIGDSQLTTAATSSPQPMTHLIINTTAMPAVVWTHWMNSSTPKQEVKLSYCTVMT